MPNVFRYMPELVYMKSPYLQRVLTLKQLRLISVLGQELNLSRCAERLHTTQPAVSRALAQTENLLKRTLFERTTKRIVPTSAGLSLMQHANRILAELDQAEEDLQGLNAGSRTELRIGMLTVFSQQTMAAAIHRFRGLMPSVFLRVQALSLQALYEQLLTGQIDLMLSHAELRIDLNLVEVLPLYEEQSAVVTGVNHRLAKKRKVSWEELARHPWVLPPPSTPVRPQLDRVLAIYRQRDMLEPDVETDSPLLALELLKNSSMLWAVASQQAQNFCRHGQVSIINAPQELLRGPMCCMRLHEATDKHAAQVFVGCLQDAILSTQTH